MNNKILHLSFHNGCHNDLTYIANKLNFKLSFLAFDDYTKGKYNIGHQRAEKYWHKNKEYFETFDIIITSDTAPISRVFLQNNWKKKLIIWINNRFDYCDEATNDCNFPDSEYYDLFKKATTMDNVTIIGYTPFENYYCKVFRNIDIGNNVIKPIGKVSSVYASNSSIDIEDKSLTFFVGPYHNDNLMMNLPEKLRSLGLKIYNGRFNGPNDLANFKGVIHIPYAWSNYTFFESFHLGIIYFIPAKEFLFELKKDKDFFWSPPFREQLIELSEWYNPEYKNLLIYFYSWEDLLIKINGLNYKKKKKNLITFGKKHEVRVLNQWRFLLQ